MSDDFSHRARGLLEKCGEGFNPSAQWIKGSAQWIKDEGQLRVEGRILLLNGS